MGKSSLIPHGQMADKICPRTSSSKASIFAKSITPDGIYFLTFPSSHHQQALSLILIFLPNITEAKSSFLFKVKLDVILSCTLGDPVTILVLFLPKSLTFLTLYWFFPICFPIKGNLKSHFKQICPWPQGSFQLLTTSSFFFLPFSSGWSCTPCCNFCNLLQDDFPTAVSLKCPPSENTGSFLLRNFTALSSMLPSAWASEQLLALGFPSPHWTAYSSPYGEDCHCHFPQCFCFLFYL